MRTKSIEEKFDSIGSVIDSRVRDWVQRDKWFNFLRGTSARVVLAVLSVLVLYGIPSYSILVSDVDIWFYVGALGVVTLLQKLSVRFAFDDDNEIDEYQHKRRNRAYRRAYKRIGFILGLGIWIIGIQGYYLKSQLGSGFKFAFDLATPHWLYMGVFLIGLFVLQKYLSWGVRGEARGAE